MRRKLEAAALLGAHRGRCLTAADLSGVSASSGMPNAPREGGEGWPSPDSAGLPRVSSASRPSPAAAGSELQLNRPNYITGFL